MYIRPFFLVLVAFLLHFYSFSQVQAQFTADTTESCDPLTVSFTDQSTGNITSWSWDFDGQTSNAQNPSFTFTQKKSYTIKLTVSDGTNSDTETKQDYISIYNHPIANYSSSILEGCSPLTVNFTNSSTIGDAAIQSYSWDFGDGSLPSTQKDPTHTYQTKSNPKYPVSLEITDQNGCSDVVIVDSIIVTETPEAKFSSFNRSDSCGAPYTVEFQNLSTGGSNLTYEWDFGDASPTSNQLNPIHTYTNQGRYDVQLIASDPSCSDTLIQKSFVRLESTSADFSLPKDTTCIGDTLQFFNNSINANIFRWNFGDGTVSNEENPQHYYEEAGEYEVELIVSISGSSCIDNIKKKIVIPELKADFVFVDTFSCESTKPIKLLNQSIGSDSANWYPGLAEDTSVTSSDDSYHSSFVVFFKTNPTVYSLVSFNKYGCSDTISKLDTFINTSSFLDVYAIESEFVSEWDSILPNQQTAPYVGGCLPFDVEFSYFYSGNSPIKSWKWNFGNNDSSQLDTPVTTTYIDEKIHTVELAVEDDSGCVTIDTLNVYGGAIKPRVDFSIFPEPDTVCYHKQVFITNLSPDSNFIKSYSFNMISNSEERTTVKAASIDTMGNRFFVNYPDTGYFAIRLIGNNKGCKDTLIKREQIYSLGPVIDVLGFTLNDCNDRLTVNFNSEVIGGEGFEWDFGDSSAVNNIDTNPSHTFKDPTRYWVKFKTWNTSTGCDTLYDSIFVDLQTIPPPDFRPENRNYCLGDTITFEDDSDPGLYQSFSWYFDGQFESNGKIYTRVMDKDSLVEIELVTTDFVGCQYSTKDTLYVSRPKAKIGKRFIEECAPVQVEFYDDSESDTTIVDWYWEFGVQDTSFQEKDTIAYILDGSKEAYLRVENKFGCADSILVSDIIEIKALNVSFLQGNTKLCEGDSITFRNTSSGVNPTYTWYFGDGDSLKAINDTVGHRYSVADTFTVRLVAMDENGCIIEEVKNNLVTVDPTVTADFDSDTSEANCYPLPVFFKDQSLGTISNWEWKFGNEGNSVFQDPFHSYTQPGNYDVFLKVTSPNGCADSILKTDFIRINGPNAEFTISKEEACINEELTFSIVQTNKVADYIWNFGDNTIDSINPATHTYTSTGDFIVSLNVSDTSGKCNVSISDTISIRDIYADFSINDDTACVPFTANFTNLSRGENSIQWRFENNATSNQENPSFDYNTAGSYVVSLSITSDIGCLDTAYKTIEVFPYPTLITTPDTGVCQGNEVVLTASGALTYSWSPNRFLSQIWGNKVISRPDTTITYTVSGRNIADCESTEEIEVFVPQNPINNPLEDTTLYIGESLTLNVNAGLGYNYFWSPTEDLSCPDCPFLIAQPLENREYVVDIYDSYGCFFVRDTIEINVIELFTLDIPKAFSPNGDGINDIIFARGAGLKELLSFKVYNRFGEIVFETNDFNQGWDGTFKGKQQNIETYIYTIEALTYGNKTLSKKGNISLLR